MADDANQPLPRLPFLFAQRLAQVGEHEQLVGASALAELAAADFPAPDAAGEHGVDDARRFAAQAVREIQLLGAASEQPLRRLAQKPRPGAVDELQLVFLVEREHRHVDLRHHLPQQRRRLEGVQPLMAQRLDERVHLDHHLAERVAAARAAGPDGKIPLAEGRQQVGESLERQHDALAQRKREAEAERRDEDRERPLDLGGCSRRSRGR